MWRDVMASRVAIVDQDKYPTGDPLAQEVSLTLIRTFGTLNSLMNDYLAPYSLSRARLHVLNFLARAPEGTMRMREIGSALRVTKAYVTNLIDGLQRDGLVERTSDPQDRRGIQTRITAAGRDRLGKAMPAHLDQLRQLWSGLEEDEKLMLIHLLAKARGQLLIASGGTIEPNDQSLPL